MKTITIFLWCLVGLVLGTVVALGQNPTPIANLQRATTVYTTNIIPVVTNPGQTNGTKGVELDDFLASLVGFPGWPSVSVTNAIGTVKTNGTTLTASATSINFVQGSNTVIRATNTSGSVSIEINASASSGGSVNTNLQLQSLKVFGNQTNVGNLAFGTNYYWTDSGVNTLQLVDPKRGGAALTFEGSDGGITFGINATATPYIDVVAPMNVYESFNLPGHNVAVGRVWTATNASTGAGEWQAVGGGGGGSGTDLHVFTNGALALIATNVNFQTGITGSVSGTTVNLGIDSRALNWAVVASTTNVNGVSNYVGSVSNLVNTKQHGTAILTNLSGTGAITNLNWSIIASITNLNGVSNYVGAISNYVDTASSNRVRLAAGTGGITVSQSGSGGVQTWTINDDDAGGVVSVVTNFQRGLFTNQVELVSSNLADSTNVTLTIGQAGAYRWSPSNNAALAIAGTWPATYQEIKVTLVITNGQTSIVLPYGNINGQTNVALLSSPSTNELVIVSDGASQWVKSGNTLATGSGNHVMLSNAPVVTALTLNGVATNSIPYIGGGGVVSTASLSGLTLSSGVLTVSASEAPQFTKRVMWYQPNTGTTLSSHGPTSAASGAGLANVAPSVTNGMGIRYYTAATTNALAYLAETTPSLMTNRNMRYMATSAVTNLVGGAQYMFGFCPSTIGGEEDPRLTVRQRAMWILNTTNSGNWFLVTSTTGAGNYTYVDSGVPADQGIHRFEIVFTPTLVTGRIDGTNYATSASNIPTTTQLRWLACAATHHAQVQAFDIFSLYVEQDY